MYDRRVLVVAAAGLCAALWTYACGDGATEPPTPAPDPPRPATVAVAPATVQFTALGATEQLTVEVRDQHGSVMTGATVTWSSSAAAVATVSVTGLVTAIGNGTATITGTAGQASGTAAVTVAQVAAGITVTPAADTLVVGDTLRLTAEAADAYPKRRNSWQAICRSGGATARTRSSTSMARAENTGSVHCGRAPKLCSRNSCRGGQPAKPSS